MINMNWKSVRIKLTKEQIEEVEKELGIHLPSDYKEVIGNINGGALKDAYISLNKKENIAYSRNVSLSKKSSFSVFDITSKEEIAKNHLFPFGSVGNGDYFCFDLRRHIVVLYLHETDKKVKVCNTYTELMKMIKWDEE